MALIEDWLPPSRSNWELIIYLWQYFPLFAGVQWLTTWYPMGKTSISSRLNIPGKLGWATMEAPGFILLLYIMFTLPQQLGIESLPWQNWLMGAMFTVHYLYRALLAPLVLSPSMSPIHILVWAFAFVWQLVTAVSFGGWLSGYGPKTAQDWSGRQYAVVLGFLLWLGGYIATIYHDGVLRKIRQDARRQKSKGDKSANKKDRGDVNRLYQVPQDGLFCFILYPHYFCEWMEWTGFWVLAGLGCVPARSFVVNEVAAMLPRAVNGKAWYIGKFGKSEIGSRKAVIPGLL